MKTHPFNKSSFSMESRHIHTKKLQISTVNGLNLGTKRRVA